MKSARRGIAGVAAAALTATGLSVLGVATAPSAHAEEVSVDDASFTWGLNGYAQKGIFAPWSFKDLTGNVTQLAGSVSGGNQTEYVVAPVPATSMPVSDPQKTPNAVKFTAGTGTADPQTGEVDLAWTGSYTVNAYPPVYNAPNEIYSDPELTLDAEGSGELTMKFALGAGQDMEGNPTPAQDFGRLTLMTFSDGAVDETGLGTFRATPDYQGVEVTVPSAELQQNRSCTTAGGATGWWGAWPSTFVNALPSSVRAHFYSTGCGGNQDLKSALPVDVDLGVSEPEPEQAQVSVSQTTLAAEGTHQVTVTGSGFDPALATGTRPPLNGKPAGTYIVFGKFAEAWRPSAGASSATRVNSSQKWAVLAEDMNTIGGPNAGAVELEADGTFTATVTVDKAAIDAKATAADLTRYGIYTYAAGGATQALYETYTPITFTAKPEPKPEPKPTPSATVALAKKPNAKGKKGSVTITSTGLAGQQVTVVVKQTKPKPKTKKAKKKAVRTIPVSIDASGTTTVALPKLAKGTYKVTVTYPGGSSVTKVKVKGTK